MNINRQKLIEELNNLSLDIELWTSMKPNEIVNATIQAYMKFVMETIESQPPADQWIPCSEKNPSKPGYYEVTVKDGMGCRIRTMARYDITIKDWVTSTIHDDEVVVAWREPLPEPYKGE